MSVRNRNRKENRSANYLRRKWEKREGELVRTAQYRDFRVLPLKFQQTSFTRTASSIYELKVELDKMAASFQLVRNLSLVAFGRLPPVRQGGVVMGSYRTLLEQCSP